MPEGGPVNMGSDEQEKSVQGVKTARRVVIKIGSSLLVQAGSGRINRHWLGTLCEDIVRMRGRNQQVVLVSSGAIALGRRMLGMPQGCLKLEESQAAAAAGQVLLAHAYLEALAPSGLQAAQVLLTLSDTEQRRRYLNARNTLKTLLDLGVIPVVNENDTVATEEIRYGDNDRLAARVAQLVSADCLVLLSDVDGLYAADPGLDPGAEFIPLVDQLTPELEALARGPRSGMGSGGMQTKLMAARIALGAGCHVAIANGHVENPLQQLENGGRCTWFVRHASPAAARKQWIAGSLKPKGSLQLDGGARDALLAGNSLLPAGVTEVLGEFDRGDAVRLLGPDGRVLGVGLCAYPSAEAGAIKGVRSSRIADILGYQGRDELVHRDDLVIFGA
jgi:glutamate 5-kinase